MSDEIRTWPEIAKVLRVSEDTAYRAYTCKPSPKHSPRQLPVSFRGDVAFAQEIDLLRWRQDYEAACSAAKGKGLPPADDEEHRAYREYVAAVYMMDVKRRLWLEAKKKKEAL